MMDTESMNAQVDMDVYARDGEKIGRVAELYRGPGSPTRTVPGGGGYLRVESGGILGIGARELYVPMTAVDTVAEGCITLDCTKEECLDRYTTKPDLLEEVGEQVSSAPPPTW